MVRSSQYGTQVRAWSSALCTMACLSALSCGGGSSGGGGSLGSGGSGGTPSTPANVVDVVVDAGPAGASSPDVNTLFTTVTVCVPGSSSCQTIDHIQVDTASYGLRIVASALNLSLPVQTVAGSSLVECTQFVDGYSWGPVALADVQISGESASSVPVQVIGDSNFATVPSDCSSTGPPEDTIAQFGANGILGIGVFAQDCGLNCVGTANANNGVYYACTTSTCLPTAVASLTNQVTNPVVMFATDNNGVIIQLPAVAAAGAATVAGSMIFGIDTQSNNKSGSQSIITVDSSFGEFTTVFDGQTLTQSFLDTGSNGLYFNDTSLPVCSSSGFSDFYCPSSTQSLSATLQGLDGVSASGAFSVANAESLGAGNPSLVAFANLAGPISMDDSFDWGLPFYYGRSVYTVVENASTAVGTGPYVAF
jgi:Protein of unknown function (DUF3443)